MELTYDINDRSLSATGEASFRYGDTIEITVVAESEGERVSFDPALTGQVIVTESGDYANVVAEDLAMTLEGTGPDSYHVGSLVFTGAVSDAIFTDGTVKTAQLVVEFQLSGGGLQSSQPLAVTYHNSHQ